MIVVDTHTHAPGFVPQPYRSAYRFLNRRTMPPEEGFEALRDGGVDVAVGAAVGDPVVTRFYRGDAFGAVEAQLRQLERAIGAAGGDVALGPEAARRAAVDHRPRLVLAVEGADAIGDDLRGLDQLAGMGVRLITPVHLGHNQFGTTALPWQRYIGPLPVRRRRPGLTDLGRDAVKRMNQLGIVIDASHADGHTLLEMTEVSSRPVVVTHTGARACHDFARYLTDDEAAAVAASGGVIGLWPYYRLGKGMANTGEWIRHAAHLAEAVGPEHLCIGTDMNGVPGLMQGYRGEEDVSLLLRLLRDAGLSEGQVELVAGENFLRVFEEVARA